MGIFLFITVKDQNSQEIENAIFIDHFNQLLWRLPAELGHLNVSFLFMTKNIVDIALAVWDKE